MHRKNKGRTVPDEGKQALVNALIPPVVQKVAPLEPLSEIMLGVTDSLAPPQPVDEEEEGS